MNQPQNHLQSPSNPVGRPSLFRKIKALLAWPFPPLHEWRAAVPAFILSFISAVLIRFIYTPFNWSFFLLFALVPLFWGLRRCRPRMAFWVALVFGTVHGLYGVSWATIVSRFNPLVYLGILPAAIWWGVHLAVAFAIITLFARRYRPWVALFLAMAAWWGMEYFRSVGKIALPVGFLGHGATGWPELAQLARIAGVPLISALVIGINLALMELIAVVRAGYGHAGAIARTSVMVILFILAHIHGGIAINNTVERYADPQNVYTLRVAMVQTGIDQLEKYQSYADPDDAVRTELQDKLFRELIDQLGTVEPGSVDLVITPESSLTHDFVDIEEAVQRDLFGGMLFRYLQEIVDEFKAPLVVGGIDNVFRREDRSYTESIVEGILPDGRLRPGFKAYGGLWVMRPGEHPERPIADYRKVYLMPFGEQVPYLDIIPGFAEKIVQVGTFAQGDFSPPIGILAGESDEPADKVEVRLGFSICFEDLIPKLHRHHAAGGTQLFVNTTNDAWFDGSPGVLYHAEMARWRSIETGIPMVRCTNSGYTRVIDAVGNVVEELPLLESKILFAKVPVLKNTPPRTIYTRIGDLPGLLCMLITMILTPLIVFGKRRED